METLAKTCLLVSLVLSCKDYHGEEWDKANLETLMFADDLKQAADNIYFNYFKGMLDLMKATQEGCPDPDDVEVMAAVDGYSDIVGNWQRPKLMGLPFLTNFPQ